jgi:hypothetical protein
MGTHYATDTISDTDLDSTALDMGVQPSVLIEARLNALRQRIAAGRPPPMGRKRAGSAHYQFEILMPEGVFVAWKNEAERRGLDGSALLRSMIHAYLLGSWEPPSLSKKWVWRGVGYKVNPAEWKKAHGSRYPFRERALITNAAKRCLVRRGLIQGAQPSTILRALVLASIEGTWATPGSIEIVDAANMYDDDKRYYQP